MVMNFTFAEGLDMSDVQRGKAINFEMRKTESGQHEVIDYKVNKHKIAGEVWVTGDITMLMADFGMITVKHQPVSEWNWKAGEMNFQASDDLDLSEFAEGQTIRFLMAKQGSDYVLKSLESTNSTGEGEQ
ncbi:Copper binding protein CusF [Vibrio crassostreae]|nr:copper binding protein CusF [Vibrio crassostreae]CAK2413455.1 Copper binding protein CusF [Vibrio crassostreae]CAK2422736.1 Copper binding protein CusF [Vibrio crassostreae]CAK3628504.1 Copper binding protein CusF [Vibrio crassostreae]CAK3808178.1 Copper binding protein CusF [Vibrio crassostreae]